MQKGSAALFLLIAGLVTAVLIGVFSFGLLKSPVSSISQIPLKIPTSVSPQSLTYNNQKLSLEFQYPNKGFVVKEDTEEEFNQRSNGDFRKNFKGYVGYEPGKFIGAVVVLDERSSPSDKTSSFDNSPFTVWVFDNQDDLTVDSWFDKYWYYPFLWGVFDYTSKGHITPDSEATVSGRIAKYKIVAYQPYSPKFMYVSKEKRVYLLRIIGETGEKILSDFKFLQ